MHPLLGVLGVALVLVALADMLYTTVAVSAGGGPLTSAVAHRLWRGLLRVTRRHASAHRVLRFTGVCVVLAVFGVWLVLLVTGWTLVFSASAGAVLDASTREPVGWVGRLYYAGFTTSTLGVGDVVPGDGLWRVLSVMASFTGLAVVTMSITYLVPVANAVVARRTFSLGIASLGSTAPEILVAAWKGGGWDPLEQRLATDLRSIIRLGQRHLAYPIVHHFHDVERETAGPVAVAVLDEALTMLRFGVRLDARPDGLTTESTRMAIASFLSTLSAGHIDAADVPPPVPSLRPLREAGIPTVTDEEFRAAVVGLADRRRLLKGYVDGAGWDWAIVAGDDDDTRDGDEPADAASPREVQDDDAA